MARTTKRSSAAAIRDVLERADALGDAPARPKLSARVRRRLTRQSRRRGGVRRSMLLAGVAVCAPVAVADDATARLRPTWASWYGPGLWGNSLGCGGTLSWGTLGVAHKTMRCGARLRLCAMSCTTTTVIDRGPFVAGREFDLTQALARKVGLRVGPRGAGRVLVRPIS